MYDNEIDRQVYLLEKMNDKYQMEIARKDRLESKTLGYYTIIGISFAAFLVIEPILLEKNICKFTLKEILSIINGVFSFCYLFLFCFLVIKLHNSYKPKERPELDIPDAWEKIKAQNEEQFVNYIEANFSAIIKEYESRNEKAAQNLKIVNHLCIINMFLVVCIFAILIANYFIS